MTTDNDVTHREDGKPSTLKVGQMWKDNDERTMGAGEFTIVEVDRQKGIVRVKRTATGRHSHITISRLYESTQRGYTYLGMGR